MLLNPLNSLNTSIKKLIDIHKPPPIMKEFSMTFSSDPLNGAVNISSAPNNAGSSFQVVLNQPLSIPKDAKSAELAVTTFYGWWTILNLSINLMIRFNFRSCLVRMLVHTLSKCPQVSILSILSQMPLTYNY